MWRQARRHHAARLATLLVITIVLGEAGHQVLDVLNLDLAHHAFHIVFPLVAFLVFGGFVVREVRSNGWPTFSWRLAPRRSARSWPAPPSVSR